jgi:hypothetical protein
MERARSHSGKLTRRWSRWFHGITLGAALLFLLVATSPARATFGGLNGRIAFSLGSSESDPNVEIWTIAPAGGSAASLVDGFDPAWSPNGAFVAFARGSRLFLANADGSSARALPNSNGRSPTWSPDGSRIAYTDTISSSLWVVGADGSNPTYVTGGGFRPSWSPDGSKIAFDGNGSGIAVVEPDGTNATQLVPWRDDGSIDGAPDWSPDGTKLTFFHLGGSGPARQIFVIDADGSNMTPLSNCTTCGWGGDHSPTWSPDGTQIAFSRLYDPLYPATDLMVMDADGQNPHRLTGTDRASGKLLLPPAWQPLPKPNTLASIRVRLSAPVTAGAPVTVTATALNRSGDRMTGYNAPAAWSDTNDDLSPATPTNFVSGTSTTTATLPTPAHGEVMMVTSGGITGLSDPFDVIGPFAAINVSVPTRATASVPFTVQATATDSAGNTLTAYNAPATWSSLDGHLSPATPTSFVDGISTTPATVPRSFKNDRVTVTSGGISGQSTPFDVIGPTTITFKMPGRAAAGVPFTITAYARDANGQVLTNFSSSATWSDLSTQLSPAAPANFVNGVSTTTATISSPWKDDRITITSGGVSATTGAFAVVGPFASITVSVSTPVTATSSFTVVARAVDAVGNLVTTYNAPAAWTAVSGGLAPASPPNFVNGVSKSTATISAPYKNDAITVSSGGISRQSGYFNVLGPLATISVSVPATVTHGVPFTVKAIARDAVGNTLTTYNASATWSSLSGGLTPATPSAFSKGVSPTSATFAWASVNNRITVTSGSVSGQSNLFNVL